MASIDRTLIAPLLVPFFPTMAEWSEVVGKKIVNGEEVEITVTHPTSDEWHGLLNAQTGLDVDINETNATAFDKWRQALAEKHDLPVWGISKERAAEIRKRGEELKKMEEARLAAMPETLKALAAEAPTRTAQQLIDDAKKAY